VKQTSEIAPDGHVFDCPVCAQTVTELYQFYHDFPRKTTAIWLCGTCNKRAWVIYQSVRSFLAANIADAIRGSCTGLDFPLPPATPPKPKPKAIP
jgi:hypothetical protein